MSQGRRTRAERRRAAEEIELETRQPEMDEAIEEPAEQPSWDSDSVWDDTPYESGYDPDDYFVPEQGRSEIMATNRTIRLSCTLAAMIGFFGLFLCFAEHESRAIRHFAVQSAALMAVQAVCGLVLLIIGSLFSAIPLMGFVVRLLCWLAFIAAVVVALVIRVRMMLLAWNGVRFDLPGIGRMLDDRFV